MKFIHLYVNVRWQTQCTYGFSFSFFFFHIDRCCCCSPCLLLVAGIGAQLLSPLSPEFACTLVSFWNEAHQTRRQYVVTRSAHIALCSFGWHASVSATTFMPSSSVLNTPSNCHTVQNPFLIILPFSRPLLRIHSLSIFHLFRCRFKEKHKIKFDKSRAGARSWAHLEA